MMRRVVGSLWNGMKVIGRGLGVALIVCVLAAVLVAGGITYAAFCCARSVYRRVGQSNRPFIAITAINAAVTYAFVTHFPDYAVLSAKILGATLLPANFYVIVRYGHGKANPLKRISRTKYGLLGLVALYATLMAVGYIAL